MVKQQLEEVGITVDLQVVDWAKLNHKSEKPEGWDMSSTRFVFADDVGTMKLGDYFTLDVARRELRGDFRTAPNMYFWNTWLATK